MRCEDVTRCEDIGTLRAYLDGEVAGEDGHRVREHLTSCQRCRDKIEQLQQTATLVGRGLDSLGRAPALDLDSKARALANVRAQLNFQTPRNGSIGPIDGRLMMITKVFSWRHRLALAGLVSLMALALIGLTPQGQVAASNFLAQFRPQTIKAVSVDPREIDRTMQDLSNFGDIDTSKFDQTAVTRVSSIAEASQRAGFAVKEPKTLPQGVTAQPEIGVSGATALGFTFSVAKAQSYLASIGEKNFTIPAKFDGAKLTMYVPSAVVMVYGQSSAPLIVGQAGLPSWEITGNVTAAEMRDLMLRLPGLSAETVAQFKAFDDWTNVLPIPLPRGQASWREIDLGGVTALVVADNTGLGGFIIWQQNGIVQGVGGPFTEQELLTVARSLR